MIFCSAVCFSPARAVSSAPTRSVSEALASSACASAASLAVRARQRPVALHVGRAGLVGLFVFGFVFDERGLQIGNPLLQFIALGRDFAVTPVVFADLFGAGEQQLARVRHHLFERRRARLQRVEPHVLAGALALVTLVELVEGGDKPGALDARFVDARFRVTQTALHRVEARFGFGHLARQARGLHARFVEQDMLRALLIIGYQQPLTRGGDIGFERDNALFGGDQPFIEPAVLLAQCEAFPRPLREIRFQIGDLRAPGGEVDGEIGLGRFQRMQQTLRGGKILALRLAFAFRGGQFFSMSPTSLRNLP